MKAETIYADQVFNFLKEILPLVRDAGYTRLAEHVEVAIKHYIPPSLTSEFYGVAMTALREVTDSASDVLTLEQLNRARHLAGAIKAQWFSI